MNFIKHLCLLNEDCDGFTLSRELRCSIHKTTKSIHLTDGRITHIIGIRKRTKTFPKYCHEERRLKRCKNEPNCRKIVNCLRKGFVVHGWLIIASQGLLSHCDWFKTTTTWLIHQITPVSTTYYWKPFQFGKCSAECGVGIQKRKVSCCKKQIRRIRRRRSKCIRVPMSMCPANLKPSNKQACQAPPCDEATTECRDRVISIHSKNIDQS